MSWLIVVVLRFRSTYLSTRIGAIVSIGSVELRYAVSLFLNPALRFLASFNMIGSSEFYYTPASSSTKEACVWVRAFEKG